MRAGETGSEASVGNQMKGTQFSFLSFIKWLTFLGFGRSLSYTPKFKVTATISWPDAVSPLTLVWQQQLVKSTLLIDKRLATVYVYKTNVISLSYCSLSVRSMVN